MTMELHTHISFSRTLLHGVMKEYTKCSNRCSLKSQIILFVIATTTAVRISLSLCLKGWSTDETKYQADANFVSNLVLFPRGGSTVNGDGIDGA